MAGPPPTHLPADPAADALAAGADHGRRRTPLSRRRPSPGRRWPPRPPTPGADPVTVYAYARVGYHRSLDLLRRNGWKGHGPVPWEHEPNRGFLTCLALLASPRARSARPTSGSAARRSCATPAPRRTTSSSADPSAGVSSEAGSGRARAQRTAWAAAGLGRLADQQVVEEPEELLLVGLDLVGRRRRREGDRGRASGRRRRAWSPVRGPARVGQVRRRSSSSHRPRARSATPAGPCRPRANDGAVLGGTNSDVQVIARDSRGSRSSTEACGYPTWSTMSLISSADPAVTSATDDSTLNGTTTSGWQRAGGRVAAARSKASTGRRGARGRWPSW